MDSTDLGCFGDGLSSILASLGVSTEFIASYQFSSISMELVVT